jgi:hypothetical protein
MKRNIYSDRQITDFYGKQALQGQKGATKQIIKQAK